MDALKLIALATSTGATALVALAVIGIAVWQRDQVRRHWTAGLALSALVLLLAAPMAVVRVMYLDVFAVLDGADIHPSVLEDARVGLGWAAAGGAAAAAAGGLVFRTLAVPVAIAALPEKPAFPLVTGRPGALGGWWLAAPVGLGFGLVAAVVAWLLGSTASDLWAGRAAWFPDLDLAAPGVLLGVVLPWRLSAAISQEILLRGVLQRWTTRALGGGPAGAVIGIGAASLVWAAGRAGATDQVVWELVSMTVLGAVLGALAHRWGVEASIVAHGAFATVAVLVAVAAGA